MDWVFFHYAGLARGWGRNHESLARFDLVAGLFLPFVLVNFLVIGVFAATLFPQGITPESAPELAAALMPLLGPTWSQILFYVGFLAVPITTTVGMSLAGAMAIHEALGMGAGHVVVALETHRAAPADRLPGRVERASGVAGHRDRRIPVAREQRGRMVHVPAAQRPGGCWGATGASRICGTWGSCCRSPLLNAIAITYVFNRLGWW